MTTPRQPDERVWDPLVRLTHWGIALAIVLNGFLIDEEALAHIWIGYAALGLLALRLLWGLIGTETARFAAFPPSVSRAARHLSALKRGDHPDYRSHNPLGTLMIYALWGTLLVVSASGVLLDGDPFPQHRYEYSAEYATHDDDDDDDEESESGEVIEEIHEASANLLLLLAALHVGGVLLESRLSGRNLVRAMISGRRP